MSKKADEEKLNLLVDLIKRGKISEVGNYLDLDKEKRISKITDEVRISNFLTILIKVIYVPLARLDCFAFCLPI